MHCSNVTAPKAQAPHAARGYKAEACYEAKPAKPSGGPAEVSACDEPRTARHEGRPQRNPLVAAMTEALKSLAPESAGTKASPGVEAGERVPDATAAKDQAKALKEAAYGFAHELFQALKSLGSSAGAASESGGCRPHRCGGYGESPGKGGASAYGGLAQGLTRLAQSVAPAAAAAPAPAGTSPAASATPPADSVAPASPPTPTPAARDASPKPAAPTTVKTPAPAGTGQSIAVSFTLNFGATTAGTEAAASNESPLLAAFKKLMLALNPKSGAEDGAAAAAGKKPAELLQAFLQQIAEALGATGSAEEALPAKGSLVDLKA